MMIQISDTLVGFEQCIDLSCRINVTPAIIPIKHVTANQQKWTRSDESEKFMLIGSGWSRPELLSEIPKIVVVRLAESDAGFRCNGYTNAILERGSIQGCVANRICELSLREASSTEPAWILTSETNKTA
jgi:hypothetical protein